MFPVVATVIGSTLGIIFIVIAVAFIVYRVTKHCQGPRRARSTAYDSDTTFSQPSHIFPRPTWMHWYQDSMMKSGNMGPKRGDQRLTRQAPSRVETTPAVVSFVTQSHLSDLTKMSEDVSIVSDFTLCMTLCSVVGLYRAISPACAPKQGTLSYLLHLWRQMQMVVPSAKPTLSVILDFKPIIYLLFLLFIESRSIALVCHRLLSGVGAF